MLSVSISIQSPKDCLQELPTPNNKFRIQKPSITTSLVDVTQVLEKRNDLPCRILFKNEFEQPSGSFKLRGIGRLIQKSLQDAAKQTSSSIHVFASSGGNAGLAAAYASNFYNVQCTVVVPVNSMPHVVEKLKSFGSRVVLFGNSIGEADIHARQLMASCDKETHTIYCHPFDNPLIWQGHSEIMDEVFSQLEESDFKKVKGVACSVGGGGLYNGIMTGLKLNKSTAECLLVETKQAPTLTKAVEKGSVVKLDSVKSLATSLACSYVSQPTLELFQDQSVNKSHLTTVDDFDAIKAAISYYNDFGTLVEPACGAAMTVVYNHLSFLTNSLHQLSKDDIVVVIVCGGSCTNEEVLAGYRKMIRESNL
ncbi:tryptophan synthase beta subunit-like PLP-dependent enzyme [Metschnikowia bicuspidata var. bicuspidata NRRL YB-4993]|uniref:L-serine ammonia-lyase n=1 Tax=Metschnikowia bicuspidata var. bicuspidata NRRL YB-4993 TaxID=869754 RepID=A0A1A0HIQ6_9ASCO|nr:tryptophan synthase beta subunit-like PLP-dependent enzyme [Metschnikowia bicuspidata var. bicuspidata NRRL YB-4993]OBA23886.1 tryptophan synthase beta subunit-like PLP-dependent enzyme [Metschnikowia bicuspidata var. bicuspidata NRRL YB-4993]